jgi:tRNA-Thr(GGU) m(6)t(6)A37 methyltransferase TsaA
MEGILEVLPEFADGLQDTEGFSHLVILWVFHQSQACELVGRVPTDNRVHGVFSTRSPRRPNPIGLTNVELIKRDGARLHLRGIDMLDGTPVLDIKPYTARDRKTRIRTGWLRKKGA